ncbi:hypothetical protein [Nostoc sp. PA-18-2419]|uniref:hypothetical protein n=1 Tax=Nostoc sp. PA-18-2419 TaxID=2575443 RepID=UPI0011096E6C|nr:hypothetical protein [Nostoc sp. PA-18-2419]
MRISVAIASIYALGILYLVFVVIPTLDENVHEQGVGCSDLFFKQEVSSNDTVFLALGVEKYIFLFFSSSNRRLASSVGAVSLNLQPHTLHPPQRGLVTRYLIVPCNTSRLKAKGEDVHPTFSFSKNFYKAKPI